MIKDDYGMNRTLTDEAYAKIKQMMFLRKISPGQRLVYKDLAERLNVSQTPIISALSRLEEQGFLISAAFRGYYVKVLNAKETEDLFETREAIESYVVEVAIRRMTADDLAQLDEKRRLHAEYNPEHYDNKRLILDAEFHVCMARIARNDILEKYLRRIFEHLYLRFLPVNRLMARIPVTVRDHKELLSRMESKDVEGSVSLIREHIRGGRESVLKGLAEGDEDFVKNYFEYGFSNIASGEGE